MRTTRNDQCHDITLTTQEETLTFDVSDETLEIAAGTVTEHAPVRC
jgi:hypothetical protein